MAAFALSLTGEAETQFLPDLYGCDRLQLDQAAPEKRIENLKVHFLKTLSSSFLKVEWQLWHHMLAAKFSRCTNSLKVL